MCIVQFTDLFDLIVQNCNRKLIYCSEVHISALHGRVQWRSDQCMDAQGAPPTFPIIPHHHSAIVHHSTMHIALWSSLISTIWQHQKYGAPTLAMCHQFPEKLATHFPKTSPKPFGATPKIHPKWRVRASLKVTTIPGLIKVTYKRHTTVWQTNRTHSLQHPLGVQKVASASMLLFGWIVTLATVHCVEWQHWLQWQDRGQCIGCTVAHGNTGYSAPRCTEWQPATGKPDFAAVTSCCQVFLQQDNKQKKQQLETHK